MEGFIFATVISSLFFSGEFVSVSAYAQSSIFNIMIILISLVLSHDSCCLTKEVGGVKYHHIDDNDLGLEYPKICLSHCVYYKHGEKGQGKYYCFAKGGHEAKCTESGSGECGSGSIFQPNAGTPATEGICFL